MPQTIIVAHVVTFFVVAMLSAAPVNFREHTIANNLTGGYQVVPCDLNHDGKPDLIALSSGMTDLIWFENPTWQRHVMASNLHRMINLAAWDIDGDGIPEIVLAHEFSMRAEESIGLVSLLTHDGDPRGPWNIREIDRLPTSHRLRWADIDGSGKTVVINAPLIGAHSEAPDYRENVPLVYYRPGEWKRHIIDDTLPGLVHGLTITSDGILTAGFKGIMRYQLGKSGKWNRTQLSAGDLSPWPKSGSSDVVVGRLKRSRDRKGADQFLAAIEPWHGNQVAVYRARGSAWQREVIDGSLADGHTILTADLDGDGNDEIIAGFRGQPQRVYIYGFDGKRWNRQTLDDGGISAAACAIADLNGDGQPDIVCIGSATHNLKWYENLGPAKSIRQ